MISRSWLLGATAALIVTAASPTFAQAASAKPAYGSWGYEPSAMDASVKPGEKLYLAPEQRVHIWE